MNSFSKSNYFGPNGPVTNIDETCIFIMDTTAFTGYRNPCRLQRRGHVTGFSPRDQRDSFIKCQSTLNHRQAIAVVMCRAGSSGHAMVTEATRKKWNLRNFLIVTRFCRIVIGCVYFTLRYALEPRGTIGACNTVASFHHARKGAGWFRLSVESLMPTRSRFTSSIKRKEQGEKNVGLFI